MPTTTIKRILPVSTSCLLIMGFLAGITPLANADEALVDQKVNIEQSTVETMDAELLVTTDHKMNIEQVDVELLSAELLAEMHVNLEDRLRTELAVAIEPTAKAETLQADTR